MALLDDRISQARIEKLLRYAARLHLQTNITVRPVDGRSRRVRIQTTPSAGRQARNLAAAGYQLASCRVLPEGPLQFLEILLPRFLCALMQRHTARHNLVSYSTQIFYAGTCRSVPSCAKQGKIGLIIPLKMKYASGRLN